MDKIVDKYCFPALTYALMTIFVFSFYTLGYKILKIPQIENLFYISITILTIFGMLGLFLMLIEAMEEHEKRSEKTCECKLNEKDELANNEDIYNK